MFVGTTILAYPLGIRRWEFFEVGAGVVIGSIAGSFADEEGDFWVGIVFVFTAFAAYPILIIVFIFHFLWLFLFFNAFIFFIVIA